MLSKSLRIEAVSSILVQIFIQLSPLITFPYLVKTLSVSNFGLFSFAWAISQYFILIIEYGFNLTAIKEVTNNGSVKNIFYNVIFARTFLYLFCLILICIYIYIQNLSVTDSLIYFGFFLQILSTIFMSQWTYRYFEKIKLLLIPASIILILNPLLTFYFVDNYNDGYLAALIQGGTNLGASLISFLVIKKFIDKNKSNNIKIEPLRHLKDSFSIFIANLSFSTYAVSPPIILGMISGMQDVALFSAASKIRAIGVGLLLPISNVLYSKILKLIKDQRQKEILNITLLYILLSFCVASFFYLLSDLIAEYIIGKSYIGMGFLIKSFSPIIFFVCVNTYISQSLILANGYNKLYTVIPLLCCLLYIIISYPIMHYYGALGAIITVNIVEGFSFFIMIFFIYQKKVLNIL